MSQAEQDYHFSFKVAIVGDAGVGKSSLLAGEGVPLPEGAAANVGISFRVKFYEAEGQTYRVQYWDCPGSERHRSLTLRYTAGSAGVMLVFDLTSRASFDSLKLWLREVGKTASLAKVLVGNKIDAGNEARQVSSEEAEAFAELHNLDYTEVSASSGLGVNNVFRLLLSRIVQSIPQPAEPSLLLRTGVKIGPSLVNDVAFRDSLFQSA